MGQITIEIPQNISRKFRIMSEESASKILSALERLAHKEMDEDEDLLGVWDTPEKSAEKVPA